MSTLGALAVVSAAIVFVSCSPGISGEDGPGSGDEELCRAACATFSAEAETSCRDDPSSCEDSLNRKTALIHGLAASTTARLSHAWSGQSSSPLAVFDRSLARFTSLRCTSESEDRSPTEVRGPTRMSVRFSRPARNNNSAPWHCCSTHLTHTDEYARRGSTALPLSHAHGGAPAPIPERHTGNPSVIPENRKKGQQKWLVAQPLRARTSSKPG